MQKLLKECEKAYGAHNYSRLDWLCNQILKKDNNNETALTYKLYVYCDWRQYHLVFKVADQIHGLYPGNCHAYNAKAIAYMGKREFEKALECCEEGLKINDYYWLRINKIESLISLNRIDEAYEFFKSSDIADYTFTEALINSGKYSEIHEYDEWLTNEELLDCFYKRCMHLDSIGDGEEIQRVCEEIFKIDEYNETAIQYKILLLDDDEEILRCCNRAIKACPENPRFYFEKAETLMWGIEDIDGAIECYEKGFSLVDDFDKYYFDINNIIDALDMKADQLIEENDYAKAVSMYDKILFYRPNEFMALDKIDGLVKEHGINYEPSEYYRESLRLRMELEKKFSQIDDYLKSVEIGEYSDEYVDGCSEFKDYKSLDEYIHDIIICLMKVYPGYDEESSKQLVKIAFENVRQSFEYRESAYDFAVVYGFSCG